MSVFEAVPNGHKLRKLVSRISRHTPKFRGKGRIILFVDDWLTDDSNAEPQVVVDTLNDLALFHFDLRPWAQKFAYYYGEWEREHVMMMRRLYRGGVFLDVGSSLGLYVVCLADLIAGAGASVMSVEPVPQNLMRQKRNVELNGYQQIVQYFQVALGSEAGQLHIGFDEMSGDNNAIIHREGKLTIPVTTLDQLMDKSDCGRIGLIKMDIEGYETMAIKGASDTIAKHRPIVFAEFNRERMQINGFEMGQTWSFFLNQDYLAYKLSEGKLIPLKQPGNVENIYFLPHEDRASSS